MLAALNMTQENMRAAGTLHASKNKVDADHNQALTDKWKMMAAVLGRQDILKRLSSGDLAANSLFYHDRCYKEFLNQYYKKLKESDCDLNFGGMNHEMIRDLAFSKVVHYVYNKEATQPGSSYTVLDLEETYLEFFKNHDVYNKSHITRFTAMLHERFPLLKATKYSNRLQLFLKTLLKQPSMNSSLHQMKIQQPYTRCAQKYVPKYLRISTNSLDL